jgi:hypothetical protein
MTIIALAAFLLLQPFPEPRSVQWEPIREGDATYDFIDPATIVRDGDIVSYTSRLTDPLGGPDGVAIMVLRHARNCRTQWEGFLGIDGYNAEWRLVASRRTAMRDVVYEADTPGPRAPLVHRRVCGAPAS